MAAPGFCEAQLPPFSTLDCPVVTPGTLQFFIGTMPITSQISIMAGDTAATIQAKITAAILDPVNVFIDVNSCDAGGLVVTVRKRSMTQISGSAIGTFDTGEEETVSNTFTCNLIRRTPRGVPSLGGIAFGQPDFCQAVATVRENECAGSGRGSESCRFWNNYYNSRCGSSAIGRVPSISSGAQEYVACVSYDRAGNIIRTDVAANCGSCGANQGCIQG